MKKATQNVFAAGFSFSFLFCPRLSFHLTTRAVAVVSEGYVFFPLSVCVWRWFFPLPFLSSIFVWFPTNERWWLRACNQNSRWCILIAELFEYNCATSFILICTINVAFAVLRGPFFHLCAFHKAVFVGGFWTFGVSSATQVTIQQLWIAFQVNWDKFFRGGFVCVPPQHQAAFSNCACLCTRPISHRAGFACAFYRRESSNISLVCEARTSRTFWKMLQKPGAIELFLIKLRRFLFVFHRDRSTAETQSPA